MQSIADQLSIALLELLIDVKRKFLVGIGACLQSCSSIIDQIGDDLEHLGLETEQFHAQRLYFVGYPAAVGEYIHHIGLQLAGKGVEGI
jgi:hypothetical protein